MCRCRPRWYAFFLLAPSPIPSLRVAQQVFLAVERVVVRTWPRRDLSDNLLVAVTVEGAFEHAFAAGERRQPLLQLVDPGRRNLTLQNVRRPRHLLAMRSSPQPRQFGCHRPERVCRD